VTVALAEQQPVISVDSKKRNCRRFPQQRARISPRERGYQLWKTYDLEDAPDFDRRARSGGQAELGVSGVGRDLDGALTLWMVKSESNPTNASHLEGQSTQKEEAVNSNTLPAVHSGRLQQAPSRSSLSDQQVAAPLTKGDLLIVAFVSSLWLWAATWAMTSGALR
jgi:hypothetical protein